MIIPVPVYEEEEVESPSIRLEGADKIRWYMTWSNWTCPTCGTIMGGVSLYCAYCYIRNRVKSDRPLNYEVPVYEGSDH